MNTTVRSGEIVAQRLYDVAYSIALSHAEQLWASHIGQGGTRSQLTTAPQKAVAFGVPPLLLSLPPVRVEILSGSRDVLVSARLYDFGVVVITARLLVADIPWQMLVELVNAVDHDLGIGAFASLWTNALTQVRSIVMPALDRPNDARLEENYLLTIVHAVEPALDAAKLQAGRYRDPAVGRTAATFCERKIRSAQADVLLLHRRSGSADLGSSISVRAARRV